MKFQIIQNDFTSRALRREVGQVGFRRQPLFLQYLLRIFGLLCLGVSVFCLITVGMSIANPGISPWKYTALTFLYAIPFLFLGLHYMNLVPTAHGSFILRNTFARRTEFRSDGFVEYIGERRNEYQYRELGEAWEGISSSSQPLRLSAQRLRMPWNTSRSVIPVLPKKVASSFCVTAALPP